MAKLQKYLQSLKGRNALATVKSLASNNQNQAQA
jgi:hypothetical protein